MNTQDFKYIDVEFTEGFKRFQKQDNTWGWIDEEGKILAEGFYKCYKFQDNGYGEYASFIRIDGTSGKINNKGEIISERKDIISEECMEEYIKDYFY